MTILFFVLILSWAGEKPSHAFFFQESIEFSNSNFTPYPYVLSRPIDNLPQGFITITVGYDSYYYANGFFYQKIMRDQKYVMVPPPIGAVVITIPQGYDLMLINGASYYEYKDVYYKRVLEGYRVTYPPVQESPNF